MSLVDTDLEADVTPSAEFMERVAREQAAARAEAERVAALEAEEARLQAAAAAVRARPRCVEPLGGGLERSGGTDSGVCCAGGGSGRAGQGADCGAADGDRGPAGARA